MGFFQTFWSWLNQQLTGYIGTSTQVLAATLQPTVIALATLYVTIWGYLQLTGRVEEPATAGIRRIVVLVVVLGASLHLWLYNSAIVDSFYSAPSQLAAAVIGSSDPVATIDAIWRQGGSVAEQLWNRGGVFNGDFGFYLAGLIVWALIGMLCVYAMFLIALASVASSVLLAIGPLFIVMLLFDSTRRYFEAWIAQLTNYALITILTVLVSALLLHIVESYATQTAARGAALVTTDALDMVLVAALVLLLLRQIMPIAAGLAAGPALDGFGAIARSIGIGWSAGKTAFGAGVALRRLAARKQTDAGNATDLGRSVSAMPLSWRDPA